MDGPMLKRECGLYGIGCGPPNPHEPHEWTDGDGNWFSCSGHKGDA